MRAPWRWEHRRETISAQEPHNPRGSETLNSAWEKEQVQSTLAKNETHVRKVPLLMASCMLL